MAEVTADVDIPQEAGRVQTRLPTTDISRWVECYSVMAATLAARFPEKAPELFAYQAQIVRAERNYEPGRWVVYDRQFRREALARKDVYWSVTDPQLYSEAFTGRARTIPRCHYCLQDDHTAQYCPRNPDHRWSAWTQEVVPSGPRLSIHPGVDQQPDSDPWVNSAVASMKAGVSWHAAATPIPAGTAAARIQGYHAHRQCRHEQGHPFGLSSQ